MEIATGRADPVRPSSGQDEWTGLAGFSNPYEGWDERLFSEILSESARIYTRVFLERFDVNLDATTKGLADSLGLWLHGKAPDREPNRTDWDLAIGAIRATFQEADPEPALAGCKLGIHLGAHGFPSDWRVELSQPARLKWGDCLLPAATTLRVLGEADNYEVRLGGPTNACLRLERASGSWAISGMDSVETRFPRLSRGGPEADLWVEEALPLIQSVNEHEWSQLDVACLVPLAEDALSVLSDCAAIYVDWVARALRAVIPLDGSDGTMRSFSEEHMPGVVGISFPHAPVAVAEMFVHECSHQLYHAFANLGALEDGTDAKLYQSPLKNTGRPIERILLGFHAFANVFLFYRECLDAGLADEGFCEQNIERHTPELRMMLAHLQETSGLTPLGDALWKPLAKRLGPL